MSLAIELKTFYCVKVGYFKKSCRNNCDKLRILKMGVPLFNGTFCMYVNSFTVFGNLESKNLILKKVSRRQQKFEKKITQNPKSES